ncbi:RloB family protein [Clostridium estertheticum]|uniref:RloB family protein n=1 Tax=Clostridium estertheticum TaxID=238834 RepID=UPI001CF1C84E|nr:RloB family protein [Clostridium estertheticum]MCB2362357.1 RloB family protein [Clostridium estertheticum]
MKKLNRGGHKHSRKDSSRVAGPGNYLIVTEGIETEVNYFNRIKARIELAYKNEINVDKVILKVHGTGRSTKVLVKEAIKKRSLSTYSEVWVIFDKDDNIDFDEAIALAKKEDLNVAWSNECFELWLLLHFQDLKSAIPRDDYYSKLSDHFKKGNINKGIYDKNIKEIFDITFPFIDKAIQRSHNLICDCTLDRNSSPTKMNPCTTVQDLVEELIKYIK